MNREAFELVLTQNGRDQARYREAQERSQNPFRLTDAQTLWILVIPTGLIGLLTTLYGLTTLADCLGYL